MVQKGKIRNEWVDAFIADGSLDEVPAEFVDEVKERAAARKPGKAATKGGIKYPFEPKADASKDSKDS